jgi:hypothetical protein
VGIIVTEEYVCDYCTKRIPRPMSWSAGSACASKAPGDSDGRWDSRCIPHAWTSSLPGSPASSAPGVPAVLPRLRRSLRYRPSPRRHLPAADGSARRSAAKGAMLGCCSRPTSSDTEPDIGPFHCANLLPQAP